MACETLLTTGLCVIAGEITTTCYVDFPRVARATIKEVGYTDATFGFDYHTCAEQRLPVGREQRPAQHTKRTEQWLFISWKWR